MSPTLPSITLACASGVLSKEAARTARSKSVGRAAPTTRVWHAGVCCNSHSLYTVVSYNTGSENVQVEVASFKEKCTKYDLGKNA